MIAPARVLLVDDIEENLVALEAVVRQAGAEVACARSGREALELLLVHEFALALLDVNMPEIDGFQLAELMRGSQRSRGVPIILVTAAYEPHRMFRGYDVGAVDFLEKPVDPQILRNKVRTFIDLYEQRKQLAESLRMHETFVAALNHDLRSPLHTISVGLELLRDVPSPQHQDVVRRLESATQRMGSMLDQLYELARLRVGSGVMLDRRPANLRDVMQRVFQEAELRGRGAALALDVIGDPTGEWDAPRVARIAANLVANAISHGQRGGPVEVTVDGSAPAHVRLAVRNAGAIAPELLPHIFEPFRRGTRSVEGLGLGLFIVRELAQAHGGEVAVTSTEEAGTCFEVLLPRRPRGAAIDAVIAAAPAR